MAVNGAEGWKWLTSILGTILVTGLVAWWSFGGGVRADEVEKMIREAPPIVQLQGSAQRLQEDVHALKQQIAKSDEKTQEKLDRILDETRRDGR